MSERPCARGCVQRGQHGSLCEGGLCKGCLPRLAADGALICPRCIHRIKRVLGDVPQLCAHLRSMLDPLKAQAVDQDKPSGRAPFAPAPVNVDLVDAGSDIMTALVWWAVYFGDDQRSYHRFGNGFPSTATAEQAYIVSKWACDYLLLKLPEIVNDSWVTMFARQMIDWPDDSGDWTVQKALATYPVEASAYWAAAPCPECGLRTIRVIPPQAIGAETMFECRACKWVPDGDQDSWSDYFLGGA